jgi:hypothetical protein
MVGFLELPIFGWKPIFLHIAPWCYDWTWNEMVGFSSHDTPFVSGPNGMWKSPTRNLWFLWFRWFHFDGPKKGHSLHPPWAIVTRWGVSHLKRGCWDYGMWWLAAGGYGIGLTPHWGGNDIAILLLRRWLTCCICCQTRYTNENTGDVFMCSHVAQTVSAKLHT